MNVENLSGINKTRAHRFVHDDIARTTYFIKIAG